MKYETRIVPLDEAQSFLENMRWFAGVGKIKVEPIGNGMARVTARPDVFSQFVFSK